MKDIVNEVKDIVEAARKDTFDKTIEQVKKVTGVWAYYNCSTHAFKELHKEFDKIKCPKE